MLIIFVRTILLYLLIVISLRLMGKKQLGELQPSELVTTILVSNIATLSLEDPNLPMLAGVIPILLIVSLDVVMSVITMKSNKIRKLVTGSPRILIKDGDIDQAEMKNLRYTIDDLLEAMRDSGTFDIKEIQYAIAETTGKINFFTKEPPPAETLNPPVPVIKDGIINHSGLDEAGLDEKWLRKILLDNNVTVGGVFLLSTDSNGDFFLVRKEKNKKNGEA